MREAGLIIFCFLLVCFVRYLVDETAYAAPAAADVLATAEPRDGAAEW